jgi:hypothetical protein
VKMFNSRGLSVIDLIASFIGGIIGGPTFYTMVNNNTSWVVIVPCFTVWCLFWGIFAAILDCNLDKEATK